MTHMSRKKIYGLIFPLMAAALVLEMIACTALGAADISFIDSIRAVISKIPVLKNIIDTSKINESHQIIIIGIRLPRVVLAALIGAALSVAGTSFQGLFKNSLADPYVIGSSSGGALGAALAIVLKSKLSIPGFGIVSLFAFSGALLTTYVVYILGKIGGKLSVTSIILAGTAMNSMLSAALSLILLFNKEQMHEIVMWTMGSFSAASWEQIKIVAVGIIAGILVIFGCSKDLNLMMLGEEQAEHLGVNTGLLKKIILLSGSFITGLAVSVSGVVGFVGMFIPHISRLIFGPDNRIVIPFSLLFGAMFLMAADAASRTLISPAEIPVGILTAIVGGPFFIYLLIKNKRKFG